MRSVLDLSYVKAFRYFMEPSNYCSMDLPIYINFKPVLDYVEQHVGNWKIVAGEENTSLWNNDWVKDELKVGFTQQQICTNWIRDNFTPVINIDEVSLFDIY